MVFGILAIFVWRLIAKAALHRALPPTFRFLATLMRLPNRRFYTPATDYTTAGVEVGGIGSGSGFNGVGKANGGRGRAGCAGARRRWRQRAAGARTCWRARRVRRGEGEEVKHYDADVLTKLIVYAGIAVIACEVMPVLLRSLAGA
ncbi:hypothetical protein B0H13DRAFT_2365235 [Mycena leptocephala]|nr:hypothetical protein B0H13DRAFT_2365235 [Mycena leptocephala]